MHNLRLGTEITDNLRLRTTCFFCLQVISEKLLGAIKLFLDWMLLDATPQNVDMCFIKRASDFANLLFVLLHRVMGSSGR